eukprot:c11037_g1_i1.p1 GENE.c11037_g1_i1~~c11037_g1_i1.p1  ORF type:complete len:710 (+),score=201.32 c11037_g1_i1:99-2132(+)
MQIHILILLVLLHSVVPAFANDNADTTRLSLLYIIADDLGLSDASYAADLYGVKPSIPTPNIDALARSPHSVVLTNFYTHIACGPSRAALLTGRTSFSMGNPFAMVGPNGGGGLAPEYNTLADELVTRGYATSLVGKWGVDFPPYNTSAKPGTRQAFNGYGPTGGYTPTQRGFQFFYGLYASAHNHFTKEMLFQGEIDWHLHNATHILDYPDIDPESTVHSTDLFTREAIRVVRTWTPASPGFLLLSYTAPHDPLQSKPEYIAPGTLCASKPNWRRRVFCGMVVAFDEAIGNVIAELRNTHMLDHTVVVFHSDNGGAPTVGGYNYPYRGQKATPFQGGILTPGFIFAPKLFNTQHTAAVQHKARQQRAGMVVYDGLMHVADMAPTLLALLDKEASREPTRAELERPEAGGVIDGIDHSHILTHLFGSGESSQQAGGDVAVEVPRKDLVAEFSVVMDHAAYISGDMKLMIGLAGRSDRYLEPTTRWYDADHRLKWIIEELLCDIFDVYLGPNWFAFGWALRFQVDLIRGFVIQFPRRHFIPALLDKYEIGDSVPITRDLLLWPMWQYYDFEYVQLYNLTADPFEDTNLALAHKDLVQKLTEEMYERVFAHGTPRAHNLSIQKQINNYMRLLEKAGWIILGLGSVFWVIVLRSCCGGAKAKAGKKAQAVVAKKKQKKTD